MFLDFFDPKTHGVFGVESFDYFILYDFLSGQVTPKSVK